MRSDSEEVKVHFDSEVTAGVTGADWELEDAQIAQAVDSAAVVEAEDGLSECLQTISGTQIERGKSFGDVGVKKLIRSVGAGVVILTE